MGKGTRQGSQTRWLHNSLLSGLLEFHQNRSQKNVAIHLKDRENER